MKRTIKEGKIDPVISCPCGKEFVAKCTTAILIGVSDETEDGIIETYQWSCERCGQLFSEAVPEIISLEPFTNGNTPSEGDNGN